MTRRILCTACLLMLACAHGRSAEQKALLERADCAELLRAADAARAAGDPDLAADLAAACPQDRLSALLDRSPPAEALLWCGRARAALLKPACEAGRVSALAAQLHPHLTVGPPDPSTPVEPLLAAALEQAGKDLNFSWQSDNPDVVVGRLNVVLDHATNSTVAVVPDAKGNKQRIPATQHRFVARAEAQVELSGKTRTLRAAEEARDLTWEAAPRQAVAAKFEPAVPAPEELKKRAALAWLRNLAKALAASPPENVDLSDVKGCVAYGFSLNLAAGDPGAAAAGLGEPAKVAACEKLLGEPAGAGIPVP
ncbi:MAG: hypothetical protein E6J78_14360 [Deltaproteobacteria bacterium]|nr:MAG: hypothetical protein E6J78_14360 [Deltaproteobacteria bacterium]